MFNKMKTLAIATMVVAAASVTAHARDFNVNQTKTNATIEPLLYKTMELLPKYAAKHGIPDLHVIFNDINTSTTANESLLSGRLDVIIGGSNGYLPIFAKDPHKLKLISGWDTFDYWLVCNDPDIKTLKDIKPDTKIQVKVLNTGEHLLFKTVVAAEFGKDQAGKFDNNMVTMTRDQAFQEMSKEKPILPCAMIGSPYQNVLVSSGKAHVVFNADSKKYPGITNAVYSTTKWIEENPELVKALIEAQQEAIEQWNKDPVPMIKTFIENDHVSATVEDVLKSKKENNDVYDMNLRPSLNFIKAMLDINLYPDVSYDAVPDSEKVYDTKFLGKK